MKINAKLNHLRISPRKVRLVADFIRGMDVREAESKLKFLNKGASLPFLKLLKSAANNAQHNFNIEKDNLFIFEVQVNQGPTLKRWRPRSMGRAYPIAKRVSHINLVLETKKEAKVKKVKKPKPEVVKLEKPAESAERIQAGPPNYEVVGGEAKSGIRSKSIPPARPYGASPDSKRKFFSRQTFGNVKKMFRRKSI